MRIAMRVVLGIVGVAHDLKRIGRWIKRGGARYPSIEAAVDDAGEDGTHSILDITRTGSSRGPGVAVPLSPTVLVEVFGTPTPSRVQVQEASDRLLGKVGRWEAIYLPVYEDGRLSQWAFLGCSGD